MDKAIERINRINWGVVGSNRSKSVADLGYEYLRRLAQFFKEQSLEPYPPLIANIAKFLGDDEEEVVILDYCNSEAVEFLSGRYARKIFEYYLQLARYADQNPDARKYLNVYELLIRIIELGGLFTLNHLLLEIVNAGYYPFHGWYESFVDKKAIAVDEL